MRHYRPYSGLRIHTPAQKASVTASDAATPTNAELVAGEYYYQKSFKKIFAARPDFSTYSGAEIKDELILMPEPTNKYDKNAIAVTYQGYLLGYMPAGDVPRIAVSKQLIDPREKYIYTYKKAVEAINKKIVKDKLAFTFNGAPVSTFNTYHLGLFVKHYNMKNDPAFAFNRSVGQEQPSFTYSQQAIDFVIDCLRRTPNVLDALKAALSK